MFILLLLSARSLHDVACEFACAVKTRLHRRFFSRQLDAIFVALKLQLQNRPCKPGEIFSAICRRDIAGVSNMFETWCDFAATKIASSCREKNRLCKRVLKARLHRRFLSRQLDAIFVAGKLHQVSNMFETSAISRRQIALKIAPGLHARFWSCNFSATKIASSCRDKNRLCKRALRMRRNN